MRHGCLVHSGERLKIRTGLLFDGVIVHLRRDARHQLPPVLYMYDSRPHNIELSAPPTPVKKVSVFVIAFMTKPQHDS